jgi:hypothetical protein
MERNLLQIAVGRMIGLTEERIVAPSVSDWQRLARAAQARVPTR